MTGSPQPEIQALLDMPAIAEREATFGRPPRTAEQIGTILSGLRALPAPAGPSYPVAEVWNCTVGATWVRGYSPVAGENLPVLVYFHGGGWVFGDLDTNDAPCRALTNAGRCIVVSVDYPLAPEHPFPEPLDECLAVTRWIAANAASFGGDPRRVAVGGASSGGNLAAAVALRLLRDDEPILCGQLLAYPVLDAAMGMPSFADNASGYNLSAVEMRFYWDCYRQGHTDAGDGLLSPLHARELTGLPPTVIHTAEFDVLRDEGEAYAKRLADAGVPTVARRYDGQIHGFASLGAVTPDAGHSLAELGTWLHGVFGH